MFYLKNKWAVAGKFHMIDQNNFPLIMKSKLNYK